MFSIFHKNTASFLHPPFTHSQKTPLFFFLTAEEVSSLSGREGRKVICAALVKENRTLSGGGSRTG